MFQSEGLLKIFNDEFKVNIEVDKELVNYYRSLVPKYVNLNKTKFDPHITVIRKEYIFHSFDKLKEELIQFEYDHHIYNDNQYYWLRAYSNNLIEIRKSLGLTNYSKYTKAPDRHASFHITIGNIK